MTGLDVLQTELSLPNEWILGGGGKTVWAPDRPDQLDLPGFRDYANYAGSVLDTVFAVTLLDARAKPIPLRAYSRNWTPARLELKYRLPNLLLTEQRTVLAADSFLSCWTVSHSSLSAQRFWLVLWTRRIEGAAGRSISDIEANPQGVTFVETASAPDRRGQAKWAWSIGSSFDADSWSIDGADSGRPSIDWEDSPFCDLMTSGGLPGHSLDHGDGNPEVHFALAYPFEVPPGERLAATFAASLAPDADMARTRLERSVSLLHPIQAAEEEWIEYFEDVPSFACSDPMLQRAYWRRWMMRRLESGGAWSTGSGFASDVATFSAPAAVSRIMETAWRHDSDQVASELDQLFSIPPGELAEVPTAKAVRQALSLHPSVETMKRCFAKASRLAAPSNDDPANPHAEESPETPSLARDVFAADLLRVLAKLESAVGGPRRGWRALAAICVEEINQGFWDESLRFYCEDSAAPFEGKRKRKTAAGFLPLLVDAADESKRSHLLEHLFDPEEFWTNFPVPSLSRDDPGFRPDGRFEGRTLDRPRNGRVWMESLSLTIDALGRRMESASRLERLLLAELVKRCVQMGFIDGDVDRPAEADHYHPFTGRPNRSPAAGGPGGWVIDHLLRYVAGVRPDAFGRLLIDPLPFRLEWFQVGRAFVGDHELEIEWDHRIGLSVRIDDKPAGHAPVGQSLSIQLPECEEPEIEIALMSRSEAG